MMPIQCAKCRHYRMQDGGLKCTAVPEGIPPVVLTGEFDHTEEYPGDNGIRYEPAESARAP